MLGGRGRVVDARSWKGLCCSPLTPAPLPRRGEGAQVRPCFSHLLILGQGTTLKSGATREGVCGYRPVCRGGAGVGAGHKSADRPGHPGVERTFVAHLPLPRPLPATRFIRGEGAPVLPSLFQTLMLARGTVLKSGATRRVVRQYTVRVRFSR